MCFVCFCWHMIGGNCCLAPYVRRLRVRLLSAIGTHRTQQAQLTVLVSTRRRKLAVNPFLSASLCDVSKGFIMGFQSRRWYYGWLRPLTLLLFGTPSGL